MSSAKPSSGGAPNQDLRGIQFRAVTALSRLKDEVGRLGTPSDTADLRHRIAANSQRFKELAQQFRQAASSHPDKASTATQKIMRDFQSLLQNYERLMETARGKEAATLPRGQQVAKTLPEEDTADVERQAFIEHQQKQELLSVENELQFNETVIEERDQAISEITGQIGEVHQIFQDLAVLVHDQGEMIEDIESNLTRASNRTHDAHVQIVRAERSQARARNTWCFLTMLAVGAVGVLLLIILA